MDEDTKTLWNKRADELTVGDVVKVNIAAPIIMIVCVVAGCAVVAGTEKVTTKFRTVRENRRKNKLTIVEA